MNTVDRTALALLLAGGVLLAIGAGIVGASTIKHRAAAQARVNAVLTESVYRTCDASEREYATLAEVDACEEGLDLLADLGLRHLPDEVTP